MEQELKQEVLEIARLMWDRRLSDTAGGNVSIRRGEHVCITPRLMGYRLRWQIGERDLAIVDLGGTVLEGPREVSRENLMHLGLYRAFPGAGCVIHAHPYWTTVFAATARPIVPVLETTQKFGKIGCIEAAHGYSQEMADRVIADFQSRQGQWEKGPLMVLLPAHGIAAMGRDSNACFDIVDRIETECRVQILGRLLDIREPS
jgi:L-fuculose-phosphate aldolase